MLWMIALWLNKLLLHAKSCAHPQRCVLRVCHGRYGHQTLAQAHCLPGPHHPPLLPGTKYLRQPAHLSSCRAAHYRTVLAGRLSARTVVVTACCISYAVYHYDDHNAEGAAQARALPITSLGCECKGCGVMCTHLCGCVCSCERTTGSAQLSHAAVATHAAQMCPTTSALHSHYAAHAGSKSPVAPGICSRTVCLAGAVFAAGLQRTRCVWWWEGEICACRTAAHLDLNTEWPARPEDEHMAGKPACQ